VTYSGLDPVGHQCAANAGLAYDSSSAPLLLKCNDVSSDFLTFTEVPFLLFYAYLWKQWILFTFFFLYKRYWKNVRGQSGNYAVFNDGNEKLSNEGNISFTGYKKDWFGSLIGKVMWLTSIIIMVIFGVLIMDYYQLLLPDQRLVFIDHTNLSKVFIVFWHFALSWFVGLYLCASWLQTYLLMPTAINSLPDYILVNKKIEPAIKQPGMGKLVEWLHAVEQPFRRFTNTEFSSTLIPVDYSNDRPASVDFECVRYVYNPAKGSFETSQFNIGSTCTSLHQQKKGLTSAVALERMNLSGPNQVLFQHDSIMSMLFVEFTGLYYLYQFMILLVWWYFAYYYMAFLLTSVIIISGMTKVFVSADQQKRVINMATFKSTVMTLRDDKWTELDTPSLVPGDVIQINVSEHPISVDCVLLSGEAVMDESSLTGEALPIAKINISNESSEFSIEAQGKRTCLFAGCHILEVQREKTCDPVTALVLATGAGTSKGRLVKDMLYASPIMFVFAEHLKIVFPLLFVWGMVMLIASIMILKSNDIDSWFYGMFTISQILSPLLPAVLVIGQSVSARRLAAKGIMCVDLQRITLAGMLMLTVRKG
jgi:E1-E2 ATPase